MSEENIEKTEVVAPAKTSLSLTTLIMIVVIAMVCSAGGGLMSWFLVTKTMRDEAKVGEGQESAKSNHDEVAEAIEKGGALPLDPFVVNLADTDAVRYLRINVSLMVDDKTHMKELLENTALQFKVRDVILQTLTQKTSGDLINDEGKNKLRELIKEKITVYFKTPKLVDVMFTDFVIQL